MKWGEDEDAILRRLWADGWSCGQIAVKMNCGFSRNAVIGRSRRLALPERNSGPKRKQTRHAETAKKIRRKSPFHFAPAIEPKADLAFTPRAAKVEPLMVLFDDLGTDQCRFAYGEEAPYFFCGHPQQPDSSYCGPHHRLCRLPAPQPTPRAERRAA
jgi:GcrA cell cycle regulator